MRHSSQDEAHTCVSLIEMVYTDALRSSSRQQRSEQIRTHTQCNETTKTIDPFGLCSKDPARSQTRVSILEIISYD